MSNNKFKFIVDENNNKIAVQMDIDIFEAIEPMIEDYGLAKAIQDTKDDGTVTFEEAIQLLDQIDRK